MRLLLVLPFVALTFLSWGIYGPVLHLGQDAMDGSSLRPFICVGLAYFLVAVVIPLAVLRSRGETGNWTTGGTFWSLSAGVAGAIGALGIVLAFKNGGQPAYVMPLVFGLAPVVNTFTTMTMTRTYKEANAIFYVGVLLVATGAAGVLYFNAGGTESNVGTLSIVEFPIVLLAIALTALCWGAYGPVLHKGQMKMGGSRLRPFLCVGLAYFLIAVIVPAAVLGVWPEPGEWSISGTLYSLVAGSAGAVGALGIILAFNFGGKPVFVMPLVFGGAPVVNTFSTLLGQGKISQAPVMFFVSLGLVILGAVTVLVFAPKTKNTAPRDEVNSEVTD
ncbi:MAG: hypothetical protein MK165_09670 [Pirellulaceae bacterium]|nr:hypothetical protein [Pirellulaceae bacterium]